MRNKPKASPNIWDLNRPRFRTHPDKALSDVKAYALTLDGKEPTAAGYNKWGRFSSDTIRRIFGSWENACKEAGVKAAFKHKHSIQELLDHMAEVGKWRDAIPTGGDLRKYNALHGTTITVDAYSRRWSSYRNFIKLFVYFMNGQISKTELIDKAEVKPRRKRISDKTRCLVLQRDNWTCVDCGSTAEDEVKLHIHHVKPVSAGGGNELDNLVTNCDRCNLGKSDKILR